MSLSKIFKTDGKKEVEGVVVKYGVDTEEKKAPFFVISRMGKSNKAYSKALEKQTRPFRRQIELGTMNSDLAEKIFMEVFVKTVVKDWGNIPNSDLTGNEEDEGFASFTGENAMKLFKNLPDLYEDLQEQAKSAALFRDEALKEEAGN